MMLGQRIKEERESRNWTQNNLADTLHVSRQAVSKWELGTAYPDIERLIQLSDLFEITLDSLIKGDNTLQQKIVIKNKPKRNELLVFIEDYWWLIFPIGGFLSWIIPDVVHGVVQALR